MPPSESVTYGSYLALEELLELQRPRSATGGAEHPDELLFIVVHQASELWFKVILHEIDALSSAFDARQAESALWHLGRLNGLMRIVSSQLSALDTLPPQRFLQFRSYLGTSSGAQSAQFRAIEVAAGMRDPEHVAMLSAHGELPEIVARMLERATLQDGFLGLLEHADVTPEALYTGPGPSTLFLLAEGLLEFEQTFARWRFQHVQLVERIIGPGTGGTGGSLGARALARTMSHRLFPVLWDLRSRLYGAAAHG